ncbi:hypothetical protein C8R43DRAFT_42730 [Mycena crocata]|nr:hypothetical protein C8R43DRAFT_42730 [Mycena crocata]
MVDFGNLDLSTAPKTCQSACSTFTQVDKTCTSEIRCLCSDKVGEALGPCFSCLAAVANTTQASTTAHLVLNQWAKVCNSGGMAVGTPSLAPHTVVQSTGLASASGSANSASASGSAKSSDANSSSAPATSNSATSNSTASGSSSASASASSASNSGKPNSAEVPLQETSVLKAVVGALLAAFFI